MHGHLHHLRHDIPTIPIRPEIESKVLHVRCLWLVVDDHIEDVDEKDEEVQPDTVVGAAVLDLGLLEVFEFAVYGGAVCFLQELLLEGVGDLEWGLWETQGEQFAVDHLDCLGVVAEEVQGLLFFGDLDVLLGVVLQHKV